MMTVTPDRYGLRTPPRFPAELDHRRTEAGVSPSLTPTTRERELTLFERARRQRGLVTAQQLRADGWTPQQVHRYHRQGRLRVVHPGVWAVPGAPASWDQDLAAAIFAAGDAATASHRSAMALQTIEPAVRAAPNPIEVSLPADGDAELHGVRVHRVILPAHHVTEIDGLRCTTYARTLVDCARRLGPTQLERALDHGLVTNRTSLAELHGVIDALPPAPGRRRAGLRRLLDQRVAECEAAESSPEIHVLATIAAAGLPMPVAQYWVSVDGEDFRLDAAYPEFHLGIEYQGWDPHRTRSAFDADHRRNRLLTIAGWSILYFTSKSTPAEIIDNITRVRATSRRA